jgi:hypothetical protein
MRQIHNRKIPTNFSIINLVGFLGIINESIHTNAYHTFIEELKTHQEKICKPK